MRPLVLAVLAALCLAAPAAALTRYVEPTTGVGSGPCTDPLDPCTLARGNAVVQAGDVVRMRAGNYNTSGADINPGVTGTIGSRILYRPDTLGNPVNVDQIILAAGRSYISVWNVRTFSATGISMTAGATRTGDSLVNVTAISPAVLHNLTSSVIYNCTIGDTVTTGGVTHIQADNWNNVTLRRSTLLIKSNNQLSTRPFYPGNWQSCTVDSNQWFFLISAGAPGSEQGSMFRASQNNTFKDNHWRFQDRQGAAAGFALGFRDNTIGNFSFLRDTFTQVMPSQPGSFMRGSGQTSPAHNMSWTNCVIRMGRSIEPAWNSTNWSFVGCQIAIYRTNSNPGLVAPLAGNTTGLTMRHCTVLYYRGDGSSDPYFANEVDLGSATITDNVFMRMQSVTSTACPARSVVNTSSASPSWNRNVYYLYNKHAALDSSQAVNVGSSCSATGAGTTACTSWGNDCNSRWGGPDATYMIADTTFYPNSGLPDFTPAAKGLIVHTMWPDGYVGAINTAGGGPPPDTTPPDSVHIKATALSTTSIRVSWLDQGDDGNTGTAATYDLRRSISEITSANFASATVVPTGMVPQVAGTYRTFDDATPPLTPGTTYWYALKVSDEVPNIGAFGVADSESTLPTVRAPATYYVTKGGAAGNSGASFKTGEAKSLDWALNFAIPGDVFIYGKGPEADANWNALSADLRPLVSGDSLNRIVHRGATAASRDTVLFRSLSLDGAANDGLDRVTFRWLTAQTSWDFAGDINVGAAAFACWRDSVVACRNRGYSWYSGFISSVVADCDSVGDRAGLATTPYSPDFWTLFDASDNVSHNSSRDSKWINVNFYGGMQGPQTTDRRFIQWHSPARCSLYNVRTDSRIDASADFTGDNAAHGMFWVGATDCVVQDCNFTVENDSHNTDGNETNDWVYAFLMRGGCSGNKFIRSNWYEHTGSAVNNVTVSFGQTNLVEANNLFDECIWKVSGQITFGYKDGDVGNYLDGNKWHRCQFAVRGLQQNGTDSTHAGAVAPFRFDGAGTPGVSGQTINTTFRHCTFYSPRGVTPFAPRKDTETYVSSDSLWLRWQSTVLKQCIIAGKPASTNADDLAQIDFSTVDPSASDTNLYVQLGSNQDSTKIASRSSSTQVMSIGGICASEGHDCASRASYTQFFTDTTWATLNLKPVAASAALFGPDGYVGALNADPVVDCVVDDFERSTLGNSWLQRIGSDLHILGSSDMTATTSGDQLAVMNRNPTKLTFANNQYAWIKVAQFAGSSACVMVRADTSGTLDSYFLCSDGGGMSVFSYDGGSFRSISSSGVAPSAGDTLKLWAIGDSLICYNNMQSVMRVRDNHANAKTSGWPGAGVSGAGTEDVLIEWFTACDASVASDVTAPDTTTVLATALDYQNIQLTWVDQGDDANSGLADSIEIRVSSSAITSGNYASATPILHALVPFAPGTVRNYTYGPGLTPSTTYWFAIKYGDEVPNFGAFGNSDSATTPAAPDTIPPDSVSIFARLAFPNGVKLTWTSPGDDVNTGTANNYDVRYATEFITSGNYLDEAQASGEPAPSISGTAQSFTFFGLEKNRTYYFAMTTLDENGNRSLVSNTVSVTTADTVASTAPYGATQNWTWNYPRFFLYGGSSNVPFHRAFPLVTTDSSAAALPEVVNEAMLDSLARFKLICLNPNTYNFDAAVTAIRGLRQRRPDIKILAEPRGSSAFHTDSIECSGGRVEPGCTGTDYKERNYEHLMWRAAREGGGGWTTGTGCAGGSPFAKCLPTDSTGSRGFLWQVGLGQKGFFWGTRDAGYGNNNNANSCLLNVNLAWKDEFGRFAIVDSIYSIWQRQYVNPRDPVTGLPVFDGIMVDLSTNSFEVITTSTDNVDHVRAGYATRAEFNVAWEQAWHFLYQKIRDIAGDEFIVAGNAGSGRGFDTMNGWMRENWPLQQGGTWWTNYHWTAGGALNDMERYKYLPHHNPVFVATCVNDSCSDQPVTNVDTLAVVRKNTRWAMGTACMADGAAMSGPPFASLARSGITSKRSYAFWANDEQAVDTVSQHSKIENINYQGWLGQPTGQPYQIIVTANGNASPVLNATLETGAQGYEFTSFGDGSIARSNAAGNGSSWGIRVVNNTARPLTPYYQRFRSVGGPIAAPGTATFVLSLDVRSADGPTYFRAQMRDTVSGNTFPASGETGKAIWCTAAANTWQHIEYPISVLSSTGHLQLQMEFADTTHTALDIDNIAVRQATAAGHHPVYAREFQYGMVLVNPTASSLSVPIGRTMGLIQGYYDPIANPGGTASTVLVPGQDARFLISVVTAAAQEGDTGKKQRPKGGNTPRKRTRNR